jgi:tetratricopeptide (TPR) repeat protein
MVNNRFLFLISAAVFITFSCKNSTTTDNKSAESEVVKDKPLATFDSLNLLISNNPENASLYNKRANFYLLVGEKNKALTDVNKSLQLDSTALETYITLADVYFSTERYVDSRETLVKVINLDPRNTSALLKLARLYYIYKEYPTTISFLNRALEIDPMLKDAYFIKGMTYAENNDTSRAIFNYQKAVEVDASFYDAWIELGNIYAAKNNALAGQYYNNALNLDTNNTHALYILGLYYQQTVGDIEKAQAIYEKILGIENNANALYNMGYIELVENQNYNRAISYFYQVLKVNPQYYDALFNLAYALELSGDKEDAKLKYKELLNKVPNHQKALQQLNQLE